MKHNEGKEEGDLWKEEMQQSALDSSERRN